MSQPNLEQVISIFRSDYKGPKIAFFITGGGFSVLDFRRYTGGSKILHTVIEPCRQDTANFLIKFTGADIPSPETLSFINPEGTSEALLALANYCNDTNLLYVVINSACTTDRFRHGENRSYIATSRGDVYLFEMNKLSKEEHESLSAKNIIHIDNIRYEEDRRIAQVALAIIMNRPSLFPKLEKGETVTRMHDSGTGRTSNLNDVVHVG